MSKFSISVNAGDTGLVDSQWNPARCPELVEDLQEKMNSPERKMGSNVREHLNYLPQLHFRWTVMISELGRAVGSEFRLPYPSARNGEL